MMDRQWSSIVAEPHLDALGRFREAVRNAGTVIGCSADIVHLVSGKDFVHALKRFKKFNNSPLVTAAITEFKVIKGRLWTETFVNVENSLAQEHPEGVIGHEFAHIRQCYDRCCIPELLFENSCPAVAREFASVFITELEEVVAESLLPSSWRNNKNRAILRFTERHSRPPHPMFLAALRATTDFRKEDTRLFRKLVTRMGRDPMVRFSLGTALQYFRYFYIRRKIRPEDLHIIQEGIDEILGNLFGITNSCTVKMLTLLSPRKTV
jgi:hypothetical protein